MKTLGTKLVIGIFALAFLVWLGVGYLLFRDKTPASREVVYHQAFIDLKDGNNLSNLLGVITKVEGGGFNLQVDDQIIRVKLGGSTKLYLVKTDSEGQVIEFQSKNGESFSFGIADLVSVALRNSGNDDKPGEIEALFLNKYEKTSND